MLFKPGNFYKIIRWLGLAILGLIVVFYAEAMCALYIDNWRSVTWLVSILNVLKSLAGLTIIILLFGLINSATKSENVSSEKAFPGTVTVWVGLWLFLFSVLSIIGVYISLNPDYYHTVISSSDDQALKESFIVLFAAGMGSSITTMLGYLRHASQKKDFDVSFVPWYFARPLMGMILGLIFFFALKGGILVLTIETGAPGPTDFNDMALAAVGALVGMFSKNAVEKLKEVFNILFSTSNDYQKDDSEEGGNGSDAGDGAGGEAPAPDQPAAGEPDTEAPANPVPTNEGGAAPGADTGSTPEPTDDDPHANEGP